MRKWIDQSTFDELLLANAEDNIERAIQSASAVLETVQEFVPEAALFYRVTHAADSLKNYFEEACTGFRRNSILFLVRQYFYPKPYYDLRFDWSFVPICGQLLLRQGFRQTNRTEPYRSLHPKEDRRLGRIPHAGFPESRTDRCGERTQNNRVPQPVGGSVRCGLGS